jgi:branched-chain amino acid transport system permease protein
MKPPASGRAARPGASRPAEARAPGPASAARGRGMNAAVVLGPLSAAVVLLALMPALLPTASLLNLQSALGLALFACATNLLVGYGGLVSFGQGAFYGIGAYVIALAWLHWQAPFWASFIVAPFAGAAMALLVGLVALRARRLYFALLTLAFSQLFYVVVLQQTGFTGGANGVFGTILPPLLSDPGHAYYFTLTVAVLGLLILWRITRSPFGMTLRAIRENRERAEALGVNVFAHQLMAFVIAGGFCALAGTLFVVLDQSANPDLLNWTQSGYPIFMAVLGGQFVFLGPALGALIYEQGRDVVLASFSDWQLVFGLLLLIVVLFSPDGVAGLLVRGRDIARRRLRSLRR